jgi:hypothetical protein
MQHRVREGGGEDHVFRRETLPKTRVGLLIPSSALPGDTTAPPLHLMPSSSFSLCCSRSATR